MEAGGQRFYSVLGGNDDVRSRIVSGRLWSAEDLGFHWPDIGLECVLDGPPGWSDPSGIYFKRQTARDESKLIRRLLGAIQDYMRRSMLERAGGNCNRRLYQHAACVGSRDHLFEMLSRCE